MNYKNLKNKTNTTNKTNNILDKIHKKDEVSIQERKELIKKYEEFNKKS